VLGVVLNDSAEAEQTQYYYYGYATERPGKRRRGGGSGRGPGRDGGPPTDDGPPADGGPAGFAGAPPANGRIVLDDADDAFRATPPADADPGVGGSSTAEREAVDLRGGAPRPRAATDLDDVTARSSDANARH
jgi:hypothetical protein